MYRLRTSLAWLAALWLVSCGGLPIPSTPSAAPPTDTPAPARSTASPTPTVTLGLTTLSPTAEVPPPIRSATPPAPTPLPPAPRPTEPPAPTAPVTVQPGSIIQSFTASASTVDPGATITLAWQTNGEEVTLYRIQRTGQYGQMYQVPPSGSQEYAIASSERGSVQFQLAASAGGSVEYANLTITLTCPDTWFFENPPDVCPQSSAVISSGVAQRFERGTMLWLASRAQIIVLRGGGGWAQYSDTWQPGLPEADPDITPPAGLFQPVRGFGLVWREYGEQAALGWALAPEFAVGRLAFQCDSAPKYSTCYLDGPDGLLRLEPWGSRWAPYSGG